MPTTRRLSASLAAIVNEPPDDGPALLRFRRDADPSAFATLVRRHGPMVFGVCRRMIGDHHLAEDAFQAVFVVLARRAEIVRPTELPQWLYGTAYRVARRARAMAARRQSRERTGTPLPESPQHDRDIDDLTALLDDAIAALSPTLRDAVILCELDGLSRADAAKKLGIAEGTLSSRLAAGRKKLAELLRNKQITLPTGALIAATAVPTSLLTAAVESSAPAVALSATVRTLVHGALAMSLVKKTALSTVAILTVMVAGAGWSSSPKEEPNRPSRSTLTAAPIPKQSTWERFKAICGDSPKAKKLYKEMLGNEAEAKALHEADQSDAAAFKVYVASAKELTKAWDDAFREFARMAMPAGRGESPLRKKSRDVVSRKALLRTLFLGSRPVPAGSADPDSVRAFVLSATLVDLASEEDAEPARKLIVAWLKTRKSDSARQMAMHAGLYVKFPEMLPIARDWAADKTQPPKLLSEALHTLGNFGDDSDFARLLAYRDDRRIVMESTLRNAVNGVERKQTLELRDVAVGMALQLGKQNPEDEGFPITSIIAWWHGPEPAPFVSFYTFASTDARDAVHAKVKAWLDGKQKEIQDKDKKPELTAVWNRFKAITGDTAEAKKLFDEMTADPEDAKRVIAAEESDVVADHLCRAMLNEKNQKVDAAVREWKGVYSYRKDEPKIRAEQQTKNFNKATVLQTLFFGSRAVPETMKEPLSFQSIFVSSSAFEFLHKDRDGPAHRLLRAWLDRRLLHPADDQAVSSGMLFLRPLSSKLVLEWARIVLTKHRDRLWLVEIAMDVVGRGDDPADDAILQTYLNDKRQPASDEWLERYLAYQKPLSEYRDHAMYWLIVRAGRDIHSFGLTQSVMMHQEHFPHLSGLRSPDRFQDDGDRQVALKRFQSWWESRTMRPSAKTVTPLTVDELKSHFRKACGESPSWETLWNVLAKDVTDVKTLQRVMADDGLAFDEFCRSAIELNAISSRIVDTFLKSGESRIDVLQGRLTTIQREQIPPRLIIRHYFLGTRSMPLHEVEPQNNFFHRMPNLLTILESPESPAMRQLLANWLRKRQDRYVVSRAMNDLVSKKIPEFGPVVREFLTTRSTDISAVGWSCFWLLQHGEKSDIPLLLRFADDRREFKSMEHVQPSMNRMNKIEKFFELRDIAVVAAMTIAGEDVAKYGFEMRVGELDKDHPTISVAYKSIKKFETDAARDAAHAKAKGWIEAQKK